jgi:hypothetical protein
MAALNNPSVTGYELIFTIFPAWQELHGTTNYWSNNFLNDKQL